MTAKAAAAVETAGEEKTKWEGRPSLAALPFNSAVFISLVGAAALYWASMEFAEPRLAYGAGVLLLFPLWAALDRRFTYYALSGERLLIAKGVIFQSTDEVELYRIRDLKLIRGPIQRIFGIGSVHIVSTDHTGPVVVPNVYRSDVLRERMRTHVEAQKTKRGMRILE